MPKAGYLSQTIVIGSGKKVTDGPELHPVSSLVFFSFGGFLPSYTKNMKDLPDSLKKMIHLIAEKAHPTQIILFGSRARGDHRENSDYDIAVKGPIDKKSWTRLQVELDEKAHTLYSVDLVLFEELGDDYKKNIQLEGKLIYG